MSLDVARETQRAVEAEAARAGVSVDTYVRRLQIQDSVRSHAAWEAQRPEALTWLEQEQAAAAQAEA